MRIKHRAIAIIIVALVSISMIGSTFVLFFSDSPVTQTAAQTANTADSQIADLQGQVDAFNQALEKNPGDTNLRLNLADKYYDLGLAQLSSSQDQSIAGAATTNLKQAVAQYQEVLKVNKDDVNILVDMATAAFYSGDNTLAESTFQHVLAIKPDFYNALVNYGIFLIEAKSDYIGAIEEFNKALNTNPPPESAQQLNNLISYAQSKLTGDDSK
ncbi:tetratricopeptide repeat protein [Desulfitobacterium sp.]|uniref:tetratricopeptide repeat protein n=1 Tax=Desulfitobacterium sp. TaxID=49981 RepID=UPI002B208767|nr:tetratricopeptide repeat protein [Desulfitobacterium sp.]MEA4903193.1 tetratricopeptide repeat protein [Desulfitobacterium sp.]